MPMKFPSRWNAVNLDSMLLKKTPIFLDPPGILSRSASIRATES